MGLLIGIMAVIAVDSVRSIRRVTQATETVRATFLQRNGKHFSFLPCGW